jgi:hypothetical protein
VRGIGLAHTESQLRTGSSGGFTGNLDLVEVRMEGIRLAVPVPRLSVGMESAVLNVSGKKVTNCAVPSYCAACGLLGADPPGTYKPCVQARIEGRADTDYTFELELQDASGRVVYRAPAVAGASGELLNYVQLQLYAPPNQPVPAGMYTLVGRLKSGPDVLATAAFALRIE